MRAKTDLIEFQSAFLNLATIVVTYKRSSSDATFEKFE